MIYHRETNGVAEFITGNMGESGFLGLLVK